MRRWTPLVVGFYLCRTSFFEWFDVLDADVAHHLVGFEPTQAAGLDLTQAAEHGDDLMQGRSGKEEAGEGWSAAHSNFTRYELDQPQILPCCDSMLEIEVKTSCRATLHWLVWVVIEVSLSGIVVEHPNALNDVWRARFPCYFLRQCVSVSAATCPILWCVISRPARLCAVLGAIAWALSYIHWLSSDRKQHLQALYESMRLGNKSSPAVVNVETPCATLGMARGKGPSSSPRKVPPSATSSGEASATSGKGFVKGPTPPVSKGSRKGPAPPTNSPRGQAPSGSKGSRKGPSLLGKAQPSGKALPLPQATFGRRLRWRPLDAVGTVFDELSGAAPLKPEAVDILRTVFEAPQKPKTADLLREPRLKAVRTIGTCLLSNQRAQQLAIIFRRSSDNVNFATLCDGLRRLDFNMPMTEEELERLLAFWPTAEEQKLVLAHKGPPDGLREMERYVHIIASISRSESRLRLLLLAKALHSQSVVFQEKTAAVRRACEELLLSSRWRNLLGEALRLGNHINFGDCAAECGAQAFAIDALLELRALKGAGTGTVLHALCITCAHADSEFCAGLVQELGGVQAAAGEQLTMLAEIARKNGELVVLAERELSLHREAYLLADGHDQPSNGGSSGTFALDIENDRPSRPSYVSSHSLPSIVPALDAAAESESEAFGDSPGEEAWWPCVDSVVAQDELESLKSGGTNFEDGLEEMSIFPISLVGLDKGVSRHRPVGDSLHIVASCDSMSSTYCSRNGSVETSPRYSAGRSGSPSASPLESPDLSPRAADTFMAQADEDAFYKWSMGYPGVRTPRVVYESLAVDSAQATCNAKTRVPHDDLTASLSSPRCVIATPRAQKEESVEVETRSPLHLPPFGPVYAGNGNTSCILRSDYLGFVLDQSLSETSNCSCGALAPIAQLDNGSFMQSSSRSASALNNATDADEDQRMGSLKKLEGLVSRGKVIMNLAKEELESTSVCVHRCETYFGASAALSGSKTSCSGLDFFTTIVKFLGVFRTVWEEVHSNKQWAAHLPEGCSTTSTPLARIATSVGKMARRVSCPAKF